MILCRMSLRGIIVSIRWSTFLQYTKKTCYFEVSPIRGVVINFEIAKYIWKSYGTVGQGNQTYSINKYI